MVRKPLAEEKERRHRRHRSSRSEAISSSGAGRTELAVGSEDLRATFENVIAAVEKDDEEELSKDSVAELVRSMYEWMVFDPDRQVTLPSSSGSQVVRKMWPQGSKIDTRKSKDKRDVKSSSRSLRDVGDEYESIVASSVVSSTLEEEGTRIERGTILTGFSNQPHAYPPGTYGLSAHGGLGHNSSQAQGLDPFAYLQPQSYNSQAFGHPSLNASQPLQHQAHKSRAPQMVPELSRGRDATGPSGKGVPRYSIVGGPAVPERVIETPDMSTVEKPKRKVTRKTRVGAASRPSDDGGMPVNFAD